VVKASMASLDTAAFDAWLATACPDDDDGTPDTVMSSEALLELRALLPECEARLRDEIQQRVHRNQHDAGAACAPTAVGPRAPKAVEPTARVGPVGLCVAVPAQHPVGWASVSHVVHDEQCEFRGRRSAMYLAPGRRQTGVEFSLASAIAAIQRLMPQKLNRHRRSTVEGPMESKSPAPLRPPADRSTRRSVSCPQLTIL